MTESKGHRGVPSWNEEADDFDDFAEECFWYRRGLREREKPLAAAHVARGFREKNAAAWMLVKRMRQEPLSRMVLEGKFGLEYLLQQVRRELCPLTVPDVAQHMDAYFYRLRRRAGESITSYDLREQEAYGKMCRALRRTTQKDGILEVDWIERTKKAAAEENRNRSWWSRASWADWAATDWKQHDWEEQPDDEQDTGPSSYYQVSSWTSAIPENEEDEDMWLQPAETRSTSGFSHFSVDPDLVKKQEEILPGVLRGWLFLMRAGFNRSERNDILASSQNSMLRQDLIKAMKSQWPDFELARRDKDAPAHRGRRAANLVGGEAYGVEAEDGSDQQADEQEGWDQDWCDDDPLEDFHDEEEEQAYHAAAVQAEEALALQRQAQRSHASARALMNDIKAARRYYPTGKGKGQSKNKGKGKNKSKGKGYGSRGPCLRCGGDHATKDCPEPKPKPESAAHFVSGLVFASEMMKGDPGSGEPAAYGAELLDTPEKRKAKGLIDCGATDTVGGYQAVDDVLAKAVEMFGATAAEVDLSNRPTFKFGNGEFMRCLSQAAAQVAPEGQAAWMKIHALPTPDVPVLVSIKSLMALGAIINFEAGTAIFQKLSPDAVVQLDRSPSGHLWLDFFGKHGTLPGGREAIFAAAR